MNGRTLLQLGLEIPERNGLDTFNTEILRELTYNITELEHYVNTNERLLLDEQKAVFNLIKEHLLFAHGGLFFLDASGGTGKTFLINLILAEVRKNRGIALAVASSGIAATLLEGGKTAHAALKLPLNIIATDNPICNIAKGSNKSILLKEAKIIIWDECTMAHKKSLEALDRTLKDLTGNSQIMGGKLVILAGDFRQALPVVPRGTPADELNTCLKSSSLWPFVRKISLKTNMRARLYGDEGAERFSSKLLQLGNGTIPVDLQSGEIEFSSDICHLVSSAEELIERVYPNLVENYRVHSWIIERAILAPKNITVNDIKQRNTENNSWSCNII